MSLAGKALQARLLAMGHFFGQQKSEKIAIAPVFFLGSIRHVLVDTPCVCQVQPSEQRLELPFRELRHGRARAGLGWLLGHDSPPVYLTALSSAVLTWTKPSPPRPKARLSHGAELPQAASGHVHFLSSSPATAVPVSAQKNLRQDRLENDDPQLGRSIASPVCPFSLHHLRKAQPGLREISPHKRHQRSAASDLLPWLAAELPDRGSAGAGAADRHPRTTAAVGDARSR